MPFVILPARRDVRLAEVAPGRIVELDGRYGVVVVGSPTQYRRRVDFWGGPAESLPGYLRVDVLPTRRYVPPARARASS